VDRPEALGTIGLLADLREQISTLFGIEYDLLRTEFVENSSRAAASVAKVAAGAASLMAGFLVLLAALCAFLVRLGLPVDGACFCLLVAAIALLAGWLCLQSGLRSLKLGALVPRRSLNQITSLISRA
jgi:hypothetical protein